jgi:flagellar hook-associated protein 2
MSSPITSIQGLSSGIKWQDLVDQLIAVDTANELKPVTDAVTAKTATMNAWTSYGTAVSSLQASIKSLTDGTAFGQLAVSTPNSPTTSRTLLTATTSATATPGTYGVQVLSTAAAQQLSGNIVADPTTAAGISGQFVVGGQVVTLASGDSLNAIRDKVNALNAGGTPTHVSASVLQTGGSASRLVLTSDTGGAAGIDLRDVRASSGAPSVLTQLGFIDGKTSNVGSDGTTRSAAFASQSQKVVAMLLGVSVFPEPATITVNGRTISVDLQNQSLASIASMINTQQPNTASVETVTDGGNTSYRLKIAGSVGATSDAGSQPILDVLGLSRGTTGLVKQQVSTSNALLDGGGATASGASTLLGLNVAGSSGAQLGDTFTIAGTQADGVTPVSFTETVDGSKTIDDMLADLSTAFSSTGRHVTAAIVGGKIQLTDDAGGDSGLSFSMSANNESSAADAVNGANLSFGASAIDSVGRQRQLAQGSDARVVVNGVTVTRTSNTISDAITGVTLNLQNAEAGTTIPVTVSRDASRAVSTIQTFASAYNALQTFVASSTAAGGPLAFNVSVRSSFNTIKNTLLAGVVGLPSGSAYNNTALVGVALDKSGKLAIDTAALTKALSTNSDAVKALFQTNGITTSSDVSYFGSSAKTAPGAYDMVVTRAATVPTASSTAANFVFNGGGASNSITIGDSNSGKTGTLALVNGDTPDTVATKLNALFQAQGIRLSASNASGNLTIKSPDYGSTPSFTIGYASDGATDIGAQLGIAAGRVQNGLDVQGSYKSGAVTYAATGLGQLLTGGADTPVDGLITRYTGVTDSATSHIDFSVGVAGLASRIADSVSRTDGTVAQQTESLQSSIASLTSRETSIQARLDARKAALLAQYTAMETALSKIAAQGTWLTQQINAMNGVKSSDS